MPFGGQRGDSAALAQLTPSAARQAYVAVITSAVTPARRPRTRLGLGWLPHGGGYKSIKADSTFLTPVAASTGLKGVCVVGRLACYQHRQAVLMLSQLYQVGPDALRVFAHWESESYGFEEVFLLRQVNGRWAVAARRTVMVT